MQLYKYITLNIFAYLAYIAIPLEYYLYKIPPGRGERTDFTPLESMLIDIGLYITIAQTLLLLFFIVEYKLRNRKNVPHQTVTPTKKQKIYNIFFLFSFTISLLSWLDYILPVFLIIAYTIFDIFWYESTHPLWWLH